LNFRNRLYISFSLIFLIFGTFSFLTMWQTKNIASSYDLIKKYDINAIKTIENISRALVKIKSVEGALIAASNEIIIKNHVNEINHLFKLIEKNISAYKIVAEAENKLELINQLDGLCGNYMKFNDELIREKKTVSGAPQTLREILNNFQGDYDSMQLVIENIKTQEFNDLIARTEKHIQHYDNIIFERLVIFIAITVTGFLIVFYFSEKFSFAFDQMDERVKIEKLRVKMLDLLRDRLENPDYPKLLYMISKAFNACFVSVFMRTSETSKIVPFEKINSFSEFEAFSTVGDEDWKIESFDKLFRHVENVKEAVIYETSRFFDGGLVDMSGFNAEQKKFAENLRAKKINAILVYPILKDLKIIKHYVFYFKETAEQVSISKLGLIGELIREAELLLDNIDLLKELHDKNELLYDKNIELDAYASTVSHDLKNPLNAVSGYYQLLALKIENLQDGRLVDISVIKELKELIEKGGRASEIMKNLIEDILVFSRIKDEAFKIEKFNAGEVIADIASMFASQIDHRGIKLDLPRIQPDIYADKSSIERVFTNLVSNSIKYIGQGDNKKINIRCEEIPGGHKFTVSDNGTGIAKIYQKNLFTPFYRTKENPGIEGTGLGLAITKKIIERHGGKIWFQSGSLEGSSFHFTIPGPADKA